MRLNGPHCPNCGNALSRKENTDDILFCTCCKAEFLNEATDLDKTLKYLTEKDIRAIQEQKRADKESKRLEIEMIILFLVLFVTGYFLSRGIL